MDSCMCDYCQNYIIERCDCKITGKFVCPMYIQSIKKRCLLCDNYSGNRRCKGFIEIPVYQEDI